MFSQCVDALSKSGQLQLNAHQESGSSFNLGGVLIFPEQSPRSVNPSDSPQKSINNVLHNGVFGIMLFVLGIPLTGCAPILESLPGYRHVAFLPIGTEKSAVLPLAEHVLGKPLAIEHHKTLDFERRLYPFNNKFHLVLYFFNGAFAEADLYDRVQERYDNKLLDSTSLPQEYFAIFSDSTTNFPGSGYVTGFVVSSDPGRKNVKIEASIAKR